MLRIGNKILTLNGSIAASRDDAPFIPTAPTLSTRNVYYIQYNQLYCAGGSGVVILKYKFQN